MIKNFASGSNPQPTQVPLLLSHLHHHPLVEQQDPKEQWYCRASSVSESGKCLSGHKDKKPKQQKSSRYVCTNPQCDFILCPKCMQDTTSTHQGILSNLHPHILIETKLKQPFDSCDAKKLKGTCLKLPNKSQSSNLRYQCASPQCNFFLCKPCLDSNVLTGWQARVGIHPHVLYATIGSPDPWSCDAAAQSLDGLCLEGHSKLNPLRRESTRFKCLFPMCSFSMCESCTKKFDINQNSSKLARASALTMGTSNSNEKPKGLKTRLHEHELFLGLSDKRIGWFCSSLNLKQKCYRNHNIGFDVREHSKYSCPQGKCNFTLCDLCAHYYLEDNQSNPNVQQQLEAQLEQIKVSVPQPGSKIVVFPGQPGQQQQVNEGDKGLFGNFQRKEPAKMLPQLQENKEEDKKLLKLADSLADEKRMMIVELLEQMVFEFEQTLKNGIYPRPNMGTYYVGIVPELGQVLDIEGIGKDPKIFDAMKMNAELVKVKKLRGIILG